MNPTAGVVLFVDMRHWRLSLRCPACEKTRIFAIGAIGLDAGEGLWLGRSSESGA